MFYILGLSNPGTEMSEDGGLDCVAVHDRRLLIMGDFNSVENYWHSWWPKNATSEKTLSDSCNKYPPFTMSPG